MVSPGKYRSGQGQGSSQSEGCRGGNREGAEGGVTRAGGWVGRNEEGRKCVLAALSLIQRRLSAGAQAQGSGRRLTHSPIVWESSKGPAPAKAKVGMGRGAQSASHPQRSAGPSRPELLWGRKRLALDLWEGQLVHTSQAKAGSWSCGETPLLIWAPPTFLPHGLLPSESRPPKPSPPPTTQPATKMQVAVPKSWGSAPSSSPAKGGLLASLELGTPWLRIA